MRLEPTTLFDLNYVGFKSCRAVGFVSSSASFDLNYVGFKWLYSPVQDIRYTLFDLNYVGFKLSVNKSTLFIQAVWSELCGI